MGQTPIFGRYKEYVHLEFSLAAIVSLIEIDGKTWKCEGL